MTTYQKTMEKLTLELEKAIETLKRAKKGSDKEWKRECKQRVEALRMKITNKKG